MSNVGEAGQAEKGPRVPIVPTGEGSHVPVVPAEEEPRDIHTVWEQLVQRELSPLITVWVRSMRLSLIQRRTLRR